jgi:hypothetical protein
MSKLRPVRATKTAKSSWREKPDKYALTVSSEEYAKILHELSQWCIPRGKQQELADKLKVSKGLVSLWLSGKRQLSLEQWIAIKKIIRQARKQKPKP